MKKTGRIVVVFAAALLTVGWSLVCPAQTQRADNFVLLVDQSGEMNATYHKQSKNFIAREAAEQFLKNVPANIPVQGAIYMYGIMSSNQDNMIRKVQTLAPFNLNAFLSAAKTMDKEMGPSSLSVALRAARTDLSGAPGRTAVIVISGGNQTDVGTPSEEAMALKRALGQNVCFFTVLVGKSKRGGQYLIELVEKGECGLPATSDSLLEGGGMGKFVTDVFFGVSGDGDLDGVADGQDQCPGTPYGAKADGRGCWVINLIQFDPGKSEVKAQYFGLLDQIASVMNANPGVRITVVGHTDSTGDDAANLKLSEQRANSVLKYLVQAEVDVSRLTAAGKGETEPVASNDTDEGRAQNRRIEFIVQK